MLVLSAADVRRAAPMPAAIDAVAGAFAQLSAGQATVPLRVSIGQPGHDSHTFFMPALLAQSGALGLKVVSVFPHNQQRHGLPSIHALVVLIDAATGVPLAAMDGGYLTALRTGAASGAATRALARPAARVLAMFGAGAQAPGQVQAVCAVRPIERVLIVNRGRARAEQLIATLAELGVAAACAVAESAGAALAEADIVCCATSAATPLFDDADLRAGTHINAVGAFTPALAEVPPATIARAYVVVDQHAAALAEAGDLIQAHAAGALDMGRVVELGTILAGAAPGRADDQQITCFKSVGNAVQDLAVGQLVLAEAQRLGLGVEIALR
ncbi:MAG: ornithine cyclodeaminase [Kouleothrix sp.]|jgi:ornithine cyclodeaminase|nr:ornithine cyclodeaminase [Kouleothrix sp.]